MDVRVLPAKHVQFKPLELCVTNEGNGKRSDEDVEELYKEDVAIWKILRRMSDNEHVTRLQEHRKSPQSTCIMPSTVTFPERDGIKCMCYDNLMQIIRENAYIQPPKLFRLPNGKPKKLSVESIRPSWMRRALTGFYSNDYLQFPLATVIVRWQLRRHVPQYDQTTIKTIMSNFGTIRDIKTLSPNSCIVIFDDISSACRAVTSRQAGFSQNKLLCTWWHRSMDNKSVISRTKGILIKTDPCKPQRSGV